MPLSRVPQKEVRVILLPMAKAMLLSAALLGGCRDTEPTGPVPPVVQAPTANVIVGKVLLPLKDTYVMRRMPDKNHGTEDSLRVQKADSNRTLIMFDQQALLDSIGGDSIISAKLEMTVMVNGGNWGTGGRYIWIYRMNQAWTEGGATWDCANDSIPSNSVPNCTGQSWSMIGPTFPFAATKTAQALITNTTTGVVWWNVTNDVQMYAAGTKTNNGWLLKLADETLPGKIAFYSREGAISPRLVLSLFSYGWPAATDTFPTFDTTKTVALPGDTTMYFRTDAMVRFNAGVSNATKQSILTAAGAIVTGVTPSGGFFIRIPDPGPSGAALRAYLDALRATSGVSVVVPLVSSPSDPKIYARFPNDGAGQVRADWLSGATSTWAMNAVRSTLAWGCETGEYGGTPVSVGTLEWKHDPPNPEFASSAPVLWQPNDQEMKKAKQPSVALAMANSRQAHGVGVTGVLAARGDDGAGVAGMLWKSQLHLYAGMSSADRAIPLSSGFYQIANQLLLDDLRVLTISIDQDLPAAATQAERDGDIESVAGDLRRLLSLSPSLLIVVAAGNERFHGTFATYSTVSTVPVVRAALLKVRGEAIYQDRIVVVAGTQQGNLFWDSWYLAPSLGSNYFTGLTDIAAPAQDLVVLDRRTGSSVLLTAGDKAGTSFAAPRVAGVAAQLLAMDPTLTPAQVKDYLVRGAQQPRLNSSTGVAAPAAPLGSTPGGAVLYQLDAYGSLSLLSKERPGTPICGNPVTFDPGPTSPKIVVTRSGNNSQTIQFPPNTSIHGLSIAQGGRKFALRRASGSPDSVYVYGLQGNGFVQLAKQGGVMFRYYLERDSVNVLNESPFWVAYLFGPGRPPNGLRINADSMAIPIGATLGSSAAPVQISPDGSYALSRVGYSLPGSQCSSESLYLVPLTGGAPQLLASPSCPSGYPIPSDIAWDQAGTRIVAVIRPSVFSIEFRAWKLTANGVLADGQSSSIQDRVNNDSWAQHFTDASGSTAMWSETEFANQICHYTSRLTRGSFAVVSDSVVTGDACYAVPVIGNLRSLTASHLPR